MLPMAAKNEMGVDELPPELQGLNWIETVLIQLAKPFQTMIQLKPYGHHQLDLVHASRGVAIHLPLPLEGTIDHMLKTLPSTEGLKILVDSLATKALKVYQSIVDVPKVLAALEWLKTNNPLYKDITIDCNPTFNDIIEIADSSNIPSPMILSIEIRQAAHKSTAHSAPVIDLVDDDDANAAASSTDFWIHADNVQHQPCDLRIPLSSCSRVLGEGNGRLTDDVINGTQQILQIQSARDFAGWASTFVSRHVGMHCIVAIQDGIQIHHTPGHWITSCVYDGSVYVFDSLLTNNSSIDDQLCMVNHHFVPDCLLVVRTVNCQWQDDDEICGVMAIAFAVEIAINGLFAAIMAQFDLPQMYQWLAACLEAKKFDPFPQQSSLAPMPQSMWMERTLIVPSPLPCHILLLAESRQQPCLQAENGAEDIPPSEVFNEEVEKTAYKPLGQQKKMQLIDDDDDDPELIDAEPNKQLYLLTQQANMDVSIAHFSVQDMFDRLPKETDLELYNMKRIEGDPLKDDARLIDVLCHPKLFPRGRFGIGHVREVKVQPAMYIRSRFQHKDPRF